MGLFDKFKKQKWKDADPNVRQQAINELANDTKNIKKNQEILRNILKNDSNSDVRILAIEKVNSDSAIKDAALNDPDWKVRKAAVENLKLYLDTTINYAPENHYKINKPLIDFLKSISKNDSENEVRDAADELINNPKYNDDLLKKKINYTVVDVHRNTEKKIILNLNDKYEYVNHANSVEEVLDCAFGGDIITIQYRDKKNNFFTVDYNILDEHISHQNAIKIEGRPIKKLVTYTDLPKLIKSGVSAMIHGEHLILLEHIMIHDNSVFLVKSGDKITLNSKNLMDYTPPKHDYSKWIDGGMKLSDLPTSPNTGIFHDELEVRNIEFVCRKVKQLPISENMTIYRE